MSTPWDDSFKVLISENAQDFVTFQSIDLHRMTPDDFRGMGLPGLLPLMILTKSGSTREIADEILTELEGV
jgi:hypothetical protein